MHKLIARLINNEEAAWRHFVIQFNMVIKATADKYIKYDKDGMDDIYQEIFAKLIKDDFKALRNFRGETDLQLGGYLKVITRNYCKRKNQMDYNNSFVEYADAITTDDQEDTTQRVIIDVLTDEIKNEISNLSLNYQSAIAYYLKGYSHQEAADILKIPLKTFRTHLFRAKNILKKSKKLKHIYSQNVSNNRDLI